MRPTSHIPNCSVPQNPTNVIYSGVAGTGKTYRLLEIAKQYSDRLPIMDQDKLLEQLVSVLSWREVLCLVLLDMQAQEQDLMKVPQIVAHEFFMAKAAQNERVKNLNNTVWSVLQVHSRASSQTVICDNRASQAYFDKDESGAWYLLADSKALLGDLQQQLIDFRQAKRDSQAKGDEPMLNERYSMVSFHQAYGYEEFVEGIRPVMGTNSSMQVSYEVRDGAFLQLCQRAARDPSQRYAMLIDEINRANVARVFGELLSLIEPDKRAGQVNAMQVKLAYSGRSFSVPANVDIYATMNTQDHSLAPIDMALRRRFRFVDYPPQPELLATVSVENKGLDDDIIDLGRLMTGLNHRITQTLGQESQLGHAFFMTVTDLPQLQSALLEQIIPQLAQLTGGQVEVLQYLFNDQEQSSDRQFVQAVQTIATEPSMFSATPMFAVPGVNSGGYVINADLLAAKGEFAKAEVYQRLYE